jgi:3-hydroxyacyl-CoA dehydrogenase/enoyl-CoA hydratase/3-hydroxybutyryl-CoA epimerase
MPAFTVTTAGNVARVVLDLPGEPVNKITREVREELAALLDRLDRDAQVRAVVLLSGKADTFVAGADIDEFVALRSQGEALELVRAGQALINRLAALAKPVVVAIHGACLGGGLETALACSYRLASDHPKTVLGLPEVQLGIIPAAGGCQRLPRLIGLRGALDLILAGKTLPASRAFRAGMVDDLVHPAILEAAALEAAHQLAGGWRPRRPGRGLMGVLLTVRPGGAHWCCGPRGGRCYGRPGGTTPPRWRRSERSAMGWRTASRRAWTWKRPCLRSWPWGRSPATW